MIITDNRVKLKNGRSVGYAQYGDPDGSPVLYFHGMPGSRFDLFSPMVDEIATRLHARIIAVERPGIGLSDYIPYSITTWPDMVIEFADTLNIDHFAVKGYSSGGKYVTACAWKLPLRIMAAGIISGNCAYELQGARSTLSQQDVLLYTLADKSPWLLRLMLWMVARRVGKEPSAIFSLFNEVSEVDKNALSKPDIQLQLNKLVIGAFQQGTRGPALDYKLEARPWGFSPSEIAMPVYIWHGEQDKLVPVAQSHILGATIPNARVKIFPADGHFSILENHFEEMLSELISTP